MCVCVWERERERGEAVNASVASVGLLLVGYFGDFVGIILASCCCLVGGIYRCEGMVV